MSLCSIFFFFFTLLSSSPSFVSLPWVSTEWPAQVSRTALAPLSLISPSAPPLSLCPLLLFILSAANVFSQFFPLSESHFLPRFQLKSWLFWTEHERVIFPSNCASTHFVLLLGRTKPTCCCKTELFVLLRFSSAPRLLRCLSYCEPSTLWSSVLACSSPSCPPSCLPFISLIISSWDLSTLHAELFPRMNRSGGKREPGLSMPPSVRGPSRSQTSHHRRAGLTRGEDILT